MRRNRHLCGALRSEANSRARAGDHYVRDLQNSIVRDVRTAWLNANAAYRQLAVAAQLLKTATDAMDLAQARYRLGLSSIIEYSQAPLNLTQALLSVLSYPIGALH